MLVSKNLFFCGKIFGFGFDVSWNNDTLLVQRKVATFWGFVFGKTEL